METPEKVSLRVNVIYSAYVQSTFHFEQARSPDFFNYSCLA